MKVSFTERLGATDQVQSTTNITHNDNTQIEKPNKEATTHNSSAKVMQYPCATEQLCNTPTDVILHSDWLLFLR